MVNRRIGDAEKRRTRGVSPSPRLPVFPSVRGKGKDPRALALDVLQRVEATDAFANLLLDARLQASGLAGPDRALATELVYGVLRWRGMLDWILGRVLDRPLLSLDRPVRQVLRLGAYQLCCLTRIPDFAAVDQSVRLVRRAGAGKSAGFVNGVLRAVARRRDELEPDPSADPAHYWTTVGSHPRWLVERWMARLGPEEAGRLMAANNAVPPVTVLANALKARAEDVLSNLLGAVPGVVAGRFIPEAFSVWGAGGVTDLPGFAEGWLIPMDEAGAFPVLALDLSPGQRVLDACAGGGGKSAMIAARVGAEGEVVALDSGPRAVRRLEAAMSRLGLTRVRPHLADARTAGLRWPGQFSRVLLDAPCTGLGTIRRRPEIKWRRAPEDLPRAAMLQQELLEGVAGALAEGGLLVYSTCSLEPEETDAVIVAFLTAHLEFRLDTSWRGLPPMSGLVDGDGHLRAWPHRHGTDGFFVACFRRTR
ncbi:MAG: 16S rRNA (cytosine(967)-C(5))-methyltransferase RsmB [candidate division NC10 bacterium]|nr:16S rRNA (cytosine(967)-C(5))-methyltransferase RsmB [candidate division NC10 bacterium]